MAREITRTLNHDIVRKSLLTALQASYETLKERQIKLIKASWIGENGELCCLGDHELYWLKILDAFEEYNRIRERYDGFVKLVESGARDDELMDFLNGEKEV